MSDIFISYARADRDRVAAIADALEKEGYSIWWDRHIESGSQFSKEIEQRLAEARAVIVCWSEASCESRWVRDEASFAADEDKLLAVSLDGTLPPIGFRQYHSLDLSGWKGGEAGLAPLIGAVGHRLEPGVGKETAAAPAAAPVIAPQRKFGWLAALLLIIGLGGLGWYMLAERDAAEQVEQQASIAVLPFEALSDDESDQYFGRGIAEELLNALANFPDLKVAGRSSAFSFEDSDAASNEIGEQLGVDNILEGSVRRAGERVRVTATLTSASSGEQLWSETYERELTDIFAIQDEIVAELARVLQFRLGVGAGAGRAEGDDVDPRAYEAYLRGLDAWWQRQLRSNRAVAINSFREATRLDPDFADGWSALGMSIALSSAAYIDQLGVTETMQSAEQALQRALELDPGNARANAVLASWNDDPDSMDTFLETALERAPNDAFVNYAGGMAKQYLGDLDAANRYFDRALILDPLNRTTWRIRGLAMSADGRFNEFENELLSLATCDDECHFGSTVLAATGLVAALQGGTDEEVRQWLELERRNRARAPLPGVMERMWAIWLEDFAEAQLTGERFEAERIPDDMTFFVGLGLATPASLLAHAGHLDQAMELLERGRREREMLGPNDFWPLLDSRFEFPEALRRDPRFHALWEHPDMARLAEIRRANGQTAGLPLPIE